MKTSFTSWNTNGVFKLTISLNWLGTAAQIDFKVFSCIHFLNY